MSRVLAPQWQKFTDEERVKRMSDLGKLKASKMSAEDRKAHGRMMAEKRWKSK